MQTSASLLLYFRQVLGVTSVMRPELGSIAPPLDVLFILPRQLSPAAQEILDKMILAMKLKESLFRVQLKTDLGLDLGGCRQVVEFVESLDLIGSSGTLGASQESPRSLEIQRTWSPEVLVTRPELKRKVWADLQLVMQRL